MYRQLQVARDDTGLLVVTEQKRQAEHSQKTRIPVHNTMVNNSLNKIIIQQLLNTYASTGATQRFLRIVKIIFAKIKQINRLQTVGGWTWVNAVLF